MLQHASDALGVPRCAIPAVTPDMDVQAPVNDDNEAGSYGYKFLHGLTLTTLGHRPTTCGALHWCHSRAVSHPVLPAVGASGKGDAMKDFKLDMPSVLALTILGLFGFAVIYNMLKTGALDADFKQTLFAIVMVAVGFYLGSSSDSRKKTDMMAAAAVPPVSTTTTVTDAATVTKTEPSEGQPHA
jgi:hypothetical protein